MSFQTFFVQTFTIVVDSLKFSMLLLYILKLDCYCWWISKMQSGREDTLE